MAAPARASVLTRVLARVLVLNLAVACAKLGFGYATGAVSIISDGFHSLTDGASNVMGIVAMRAARKPPDEDHPYGHRKYETLAAAGIFVFLLLVVIEVVRAALGRLRGSEPPDVTPASFAVMIVTLAVNLLVVRYEAERGRALKSELLLADAAHTRSDVLTSCAVHRVARRRLARLPACSIRSAGSWSRSSSRTPASRSPATRQASSRTAWCMDEDDIRRVVMGVPGSAGLPPHPHARLGRSHVPRSARLVPQATRTLYEAHRLSHVVKDRLIEAYPQIADAIIHIEPPPSQC